MHSNCEDLNVWGTSKVPDCYSAKTYDQAKDLCVEAGERLCALEEIKNG